MMVGGIVPGAQAEGGYRPWTMCCRDSIVRAMFVELRALKFNDECHSMYIDLPEIGQMLIVECLREKFQPEY